MGLKMPSSKKMRELTGERRSPSKSRERRLAEVAWMVATCLELAAENRIGASRVNLAYDECLVLSHALHSAIQELRK